MLLGDPISNFNGRILLLFVVFLKMFHAKNAHPGDQVCARACHVMTLWQELKSQRIIELQNIAESDADLVVPIVDPDQCKMLVPQIHTCSMLESNPSWNTKMD